MVNVQSKPEFNNRSWVVVGHGREGRLLVKSVGGHGSLESTISVPSGSVTPLALVPIAAPRPDPRQELSMLERFALPAGDSTTPLGTWIFLPGLGQNAIKIQRATAMGRDLLMYPGFKGYEVWFRSQWSGEEFLLLDCDVLKCCPQSQVWPWCSFCNRFACPHEPHRRGKAHQTCRWYLRHGSSDAELEWIKDKCTTNMLNFSRDRFKTCLRRNLIHVHVRGALPLTPVID